MSLTFGLTYDTNMFTRALFISSCMLTSAKGKVRTVMCYTDEPSVDKHFPTVVWRIDNRGCKMLQEREFSISGKANTPSSNRIYINLSGSIRSRTEEGCVMEADTVALLLHPIDHFLINGEVLFIPV